MPDNLNVILTDVSLFASVISILMFLYFLFRWAGRAKRLRRALEDTTAALKNKPENFGVLFARDPAWAKAWAAYEQSRAPEALNRAALVDAALGDDFKGLSNALSTIGLLSLVAALAGGLLRAGGGIDTAGLVSPLVLASIALSFAPLFLAVVVGAYQEKYPSSLYPLADEVAPLVTGTYTAPPAPVAEAIIVSKPVVTVVEPEPALAPAPAPTTTPTPTPTPASVVVEEAVAAPASVPQPEVKRDIADMLETVLSAQIERQTAALQAATQKITAEISTAVTRALEKPLAQIAAAAEQTAKQGDTVSRVLQEATAAMTRDIGKSIAQSMEKPLAQIAAAAEQSAKQGAETAAATGRAMSASITATLEKPLGQMVQVVEQSGRLAENVDRVLQNTIASLAKKLEETVGEQTKGMNALLVDNAKSLHDMKENVAQMMADMKQNSDYVSGQTRAAIEKMDASAKTILEAAAKFGEAGDVMNSQISHSHSLSRHMMESGMALNASATALGQVVTDYAKARDSLGGLISSLQDMAKGMDQKITINQSLVGDMQKVADKLKEVQSQTDDYLHKVSDVLSSGFTTFGKSVHDNLEKSTTAFHSSMSNSVELISVQMRNLTSALQELPELLGKPSA